MCICILLSGPIRGIRTFLYIFSIYISLFWYCTWLYMRNNSMHILFLISIFVFEYCFIHAHDVMADSFRLVVYILYLHAFIFLICECLKWKKITSRISVLRVLAGDTLSIIGTYSQVHQCALERHIEINPKVSSNNNSYK